MKSNRRGRDGKGAGGSHFRREESHQESHSPLGMERLGPIVSHPLAGGQPPVIVNASQALDETIEHLKAAGAFALDSEFIGERSYTPRLCLVQVATTQEVFLLDPLGGMDLSGFWELVACGAMEKIVLAGQQDFGPMVAHTQRPPANIMDVQIAAGFIHDQYPLSLARLLEEFVGVPPGKALAFTQWDNRPLSAVQVRYAADDVRYLPAARDAISGQLTETGRTAWAREECAAALEEMSVYCPAPESLYMRVRGWERLRRRALAVLRELAILRDSAARREDVPRRTLLKDGILMALARRPVGKVADLKAIRGLPRPVESRYGRQIVAATAKALALAEDELPLAEPRETPAIRERVDTIRDGIVGLCEDLSIAPSLVASRKEIVALCAAASDGQSPGGHRLLQGWRKELLGDLLAGLL